MILFHSQKQNLAECEIFFKLRIFNNFGKSEDAFFFLIFRSNFVAKKITESNK